MNTAFNIVTPPRPTFASAIEDAIRAIAPSWPLDRQIAVNPYWGFIDRSFDQAAATLRRLVGSRFTLAPSEYLRAWRAGEITQAALSRALAESRASMTLDSCSCRPARFIGHSAQGFPCCRTSSMSARRLARRRAGATPSLNR